MANQMIALGVRGPQLPDLGRAMSQYGAMMNTMAQQRASQRQAEAFLAQQQRLEQEIAFAQQQRGEQARAAGQTFDVAEMNRLRNLGVAVMGAADQEAAYQSWLGEVEKADPRSAAMFRQASPNFNPNFMTNVLMEAEQYINKTVPTPSAEIIYGQGGEAFEGRVGGTGAPTASPVTVVPRAASAPAASGQPAQQPMSFEEAFSNLRSDALTPAQAAPILGNAARTGVINQSDVDRLRSSLPPEGRPQVDEFIRQRGIEVNPINFVPGSSGQQPVAPLTMETAPQIIQNAVQNRTIDESHLQQLRQMVGPENEQALAQWMQQNGVRIQPAGQPTMRSAVYRPGQDAAPQMTQVQQAVNAPGTQFRGRDPMQSPAPGSAIVPLPRVRGESEAETAGSEGVRVTTQPRITRGVQRAERLERLLGDLPRARGETQTLVDNLTDRIDRIDEFLRSPNRRSIIGAIEGRIPRSLQSESRTDAQAMWDFITSNSVLDKLISDRQATETGASPQGLVSDRDLGVAATAANQLRQTGSEAAQERELQRLRSVLYRTRETALRSFNDTYAEVFSERPELRVNAPPVAPRYVARPQTQPRQQSQPRTRGGATVSNWPGGR